MKFLQNNFVRGLFAAVPVIVVLLAAPVHAASIDFEDATGAGDPIGSFYASLGVTFSNAQWIEDTTPLAPRPGQSGKFAFASISDATVPKVGNPIVGIFSTAVSSMSVQAIDVGFNDATLDVYDSVVGGNLLGSVTYEGVTQAGNEGDANDTSTLALAFAGIRRFELYQPLTGLTFEDGTWFDDLNFTASPVPVPAALPLFLSGLLGLGVMARRRKRATA